MSEEKTSVAVEATAPGNMPARLKGFAVFAAVLTLAFTGPLADLLRYSLATHLHSHAVLIPFISVYLVWLRRGAALPPVGGSPSLAVLPLVAGLLGVWDAYWGSGAGPAVALPDRLALTTAGYLCFLWAGALAILGWPMVRAQLFPLLFLIFLVPMPGALENALEVFYQHTSAEAAAWMFSATGTTMFRDGLHFKLPGIEMLVAQECSGIRSSLVLFITGLVAGQMFLRSPWRRFALAAFVVPLGIVRNGFRVFTLGMLCVHVSPDMIDSPIHHQGGPLFFALSLVPFLLFLLWLWRGERRRLTR